MTRALAHRGPDGEGFHLSGPIGLGHRRLAIIDLSEAGAQPMSNDDESIWITYNGEIYNFKEIRHELEKKGHMFHSMSDTEVVIHAYEEWGFDCLERMNGMFSFGLWDGYRKKLWLVRDRLGIKPLFYYLQPNRILFGSEIKAILEDSRVDRQIDYEALAYFLALNYTPAPYTLFKHIRQLMPGSYMVVNDNGSHQIKEYWDIHYQEGKKKQRQSYYLEKLDTFLENSVRKRLMSDVPFGAFLSGGIDSSSIAYWMAKNLNEPLKTFSIGFGEETFDELQYAQTVSKRINSQHYEQIVKAQAAEVLPKIVWHSEEPTSDSSMVAVYYLAQMTRQHVTMALSGDGADEIFAGYETYQAYYLRKFYQLLPHGLRANIIAPLIHALPISDSNVSLNTKLRRFVSGAEILGEEAHGTWRVIFDDQQRKKLLSPVNHIPESHASNLDLYRTYFKNANAKHPLNRMLYVDTRSYLPNDMLVKVDRMTMAHGLEVRVPFLDHELVAFAATVPPSLKLKNLRHKKYLLKKSMQRRLPAQIIWRKKAGFNVPNARWIKGGLKPFVMDHLSTKRINEMGILDTTEVEKVLSDHFARKAENSHQIWCLLTLALWWERFQRIKE